jgi:hypothetical protein
MSCQCLPVGSLIQIEVLATVLPDLTFERPTVDEGPIKNDGPGTPATALNTDGLSFVVGERVSLIGVLTQMIVHLGQAR